MFLFSVSEFVDVPGVDFQAVRSQLPPPQIAIVIEVDTSHRDRQKRLMKVACSQMFAIDAYTPDFLLVLV